MVVVLEILTIEIKHSVPNLICLMAPYLPNISYISSDVILNGKFRTYSILMVIIIMVIGIMVIIIMVIIIIMMIDNNRAIIMIDNYDNGVIIYITD